MSRDEKLVSLVEDVIDNLFVINQWFLSDDNDNKTSEICCEFVKIAMRLQFLLDVLSMSDGDGNVKFCSRFEKL